MKELEGVIKIVSKREREIAEGRKERKEVKSVSKYYVN